MLWQSPDSGDFLFAQWGSMSVRNLLAISPWHTDGSRTVCASPWIFCLSLSIFWSADLKASLINVISSINNSGVPSTIGSLPYSTTISSINARNRSWVLEIDSVIAYSSFRKVSFLVAVSRSNFISGRSPRLSLSSRMFISFEFAIARRLSRL